MNALSEPSWPTNGVLQVKLGVVAPVVVPGKDPVVPGANEPVVEVEAPPIVGLLGEPPDVAGSDDVLVLAEAEVPEVVEIQLVEKTYIPA
jgi:hypothetical protein